MLVTKFSPCHETHKVQCNFLLPTSPVLRCTPDFCPAGPPLLPEFFFHRSSPCSLRSSHFSLPFRLPLHRHHAVIIPLLSEHVDNPIPSSPSNFITDLLYACYLGDCVVSDALRHQILRIRVRHVNWNLSSFFSSAAVSFHASQPYDRTVPRSQRQFDFCIPTKAPCVPDLHHLKNAPHTLLSRFLMSFVPPPSLVTVVLRYTNSWTSSTSSLPIITFSSLRVFILITLHF